MRTGEVAAQAEVNPQTLRYYERRGLLPEPVRSSGGYRAYQAGAVRRVRFIKGAQALGFTFAEVESYARGLDVLSDAALLFYGGSMLVAAVRGYAGCEVLAVSNWLLHRDDEVGCAPFWALDRIEVRRADDQEAVGDLR